MLEVGSQKPRFESKISKFLWMPRDVDPSSLDEENGLWNEGPGAVKSSTVRCVQENFAAQFRKVVLEVLTHREQR